MRDILTDVLKHTISLGVLDTLKVTGDERGTRVESYTSDTNLVFKCNIKKPIKEFTGEFGMTSLGILKGLLDFAPFRTDEATISVKIEKRNNINQPTEIVFNDADGRPAYYRLTAAEVIPVQPTMPPAQWDIEFVPSNSKIAELTKLASIFTAVEKIVCVKMVDNELRFYIGDEGSSSHRSYVVIEKGVTGTIPELYWDIDRILNVFRLISPDTTLSTKVSIMAKGLMQISIETEHAVYLYLLPAQKK